MSINLKIAKRYAKSLYDFASESNESEVVYNEMKSLYHLFLELNDLKIFFALPILELTKKKQIAEKIFCKFSLITQKFISLIIENKRENYIREIAKLFEQLYEKCNNIVQVYITTSQHLDQLTINRIIDSSNLVEYDSKIIIKQDIDSSIIGGYILRVGDKQIDSSLRSKISELRKMFHSNYYVSQL